MNKNLVETCLLKNVGLLTRLYIRPNLNVTDLSVCSNRFSASGPEVPTTNLCYLSDIRPNLKVDF
ncbi:MAG TPA: hypothetical protein V6C85_15170 [Allocoleopsis sp.]